MGRQALVHADEIYLNAREKPLAYNECLECWMVGVNPKFRRRGIRYFIGLSLSLPPSSLFIILGSRVCLSL